MINVLGTPGLNHVFMMPVYWKSFQGKKTKYLVYDNMAAGQFMFKI